MSSKVEFKCDFCKKNIQEGKGFCMAPLCGSYDQPTQDLTSVLKGPHICNSCIEIFSRKIKRIEGQ